MEPSSQEFLLEEYRALWRYLEYLDSTRNKAVTLYLAALGGMTSVLVGSAKDLQPNFGLYHFLTGSLSPVLLFSALIFGLLASSVLLFLSIQFRSLFVEYTYCLNRIRRAFAVENTALGPFLILPTRMLDVRPGTKGAARDIHRFLSLVSALVFWVFVISALYRVGFDGFLPPSAATVAAGAWILLSLYWYRTHVQGTLDNLWERCPEAVQDEIVAEAHSLSAGSPEDNRLRAERTIKERWGRLRESGGDSL